jgi:hypothetical protein
MAGLTWFTSGVFLQHFLVEAEEADSIFGKYYVHSSIHSFTRLCLAQIVPMISLNTVLSSTILEAGYGLDCLMAQFQGLDLRLSENWPGPAGVLWATTRNQVYMGQRIERIECWFALYIYLNECPCDTCNTLGILEEFTMRVSPCTSRYCVLSVSICSKWNLNSFTEIFPSHATMLH